MRPFVPVHLAGLAETLLEAELFGHEEGAFTGAARARDGRFVRASGGTVVLEAIETLALPLQVKLLRVLQERVVEPLGAARPVARRLRSGRHDRGRSRREVAEGRFREDLYCPPAVVPVEIPPLRARSGDEDFAPVCDALVAAVAARASVPPRDLSTGARELFARGPWPGNVRELENALERVLVVPGEGPIEAEELGFLAESTGGRSHEIAREALAAGVSLEALERALLECRSRPDQGERVGRRARPRALPPRLRLPPQEAQRMIPRSIILLLGLLAASEPGRARGRRPAGATAQQEEGQGDWRPTSGSSWTPRPARPPGRRSRASEAPSRAVGSSSSRQRWPTGRSPSGRRRPKSSVAPDLGAVARPERAVRLALLARDDPSNRVRRAALEALGMIGGPRASRLGAIVEAATEPLLRQRAAKALAGAVGGEETIVEIVQRALGRGTALP